MNLKRATDHSTRKAAGAAVAPAPTNGNGHGGNGHASVPGASAYIGDGQSQVGRRLSDFLLAEGLITATQFSTVLAEQKKTNEKLAKEHQARYLRFKADESSQAITGPYRQSHPEDNNERQSIHEHVSVTLATQGKGYVGTAASAVQLGKAWLASIIAPIGASK